MLLSLWEKLIFVDSTKMCTQMNLHKIQALLTKCGKGDYTAVSYNYPLCLVFQKR